MKVFLIFLFLNANTGDIMGTVNGGPVPNIQVCHQMVDKLLGDNPPPDGITALPVCIDVSKVPVGKQPEKAKPGEKLTGWTAL